MYARNVLSDARWSRATHPEFSSRNSTQFHPLQKVPDFDKRGGLCCCGYMHCKFGGSEASLKLDSFKLSAADDDEDDDNSVSTEKDRL